MRTVLYRPATPPNDAAQTGCCGMLFAHRHGTAPAPGPGVPVGALLSLLCECYICFAYTDMALQGGINWQEPTAAQQLAPCHRQVYLSQQPPQLATECLLTQVPRQSTQQRLEACNAQVRWICWSAPSSAVRFRRPSVACFESITTILTAGTQERETLLPGRGQKWSTVEL